VSRWACLAFWAAVLAPGGSSARAVAATTPRADEVFEEVAVSAGLDFVHFNGMSGRYYFPEVMGAGGALVDVDGDGDLDVFLVQGAMLGPGLTEADALAPPRPGAPAGDRLYRNDIGRASGEARLTFTDVSAESGVGGGSGYGMGVAAGDYNNDGRVDLYVTRLGADSLLENLGGGRFRDVTAKSGTGDDRWSVSATFTDFDGDGWLDLAVANYVVFSYLEHKVCLSKRGERGYCLPTSFRPELARLYRNRGDGTFEDVSARAGMETPGNGLGILGADFDEDGRQDLFVANDLMPNRLWLQGADRRFTDGALLAGCALTADGRAEASMGIDLGDYDGDSDDDLFITKFDGERNTLYRNDGKGQFADATTGSGLGEPSFRMTGFGARFLDYDNDGRLDLVVTNGRVVFPPGADLAADPYPMAEPNQLFHNEGDGVFRERSAEAGATFTAPVVGRGLATGDVDNDGSTDVLVTASSGPVRLFLNRMGAQRPWVGVRLVGAGAPRDMPGAVAIATLDDGRTLRRRVAADGSYASASDPRIVFGLGAAKSVERVTVHWTDGKVEIWDSPPLRRYTTLRQGEGSPAPPPSREKTRLGTGNPFPPAPREAPRQGTERAP
jgi:hypothetical protein